MRIPQSSLSRPESRPFWVEPAFNCDVHDKAGRTSSWETTMGLFTKDIKIDGRPVTCMCCRTSITPRTRSRRRLPDMIEKATNRELTAAFKAHLDETEKQIGRLDQAFQLLGKEPKGTKCPAIDGIIDEANEVAGEVDDKKVLDAALIAAAQAVEHYEITRYGTLIAWSEELGHDADRQTADHQSQRGKGG